MYIYYIRLDRQFDWGSGGWVEEKKDYGEMTYSDIEQVEDLQVW